MAGADNKGQSTKMEKRRAEGRRLPLKHNEPGRRGGCDGGGQRTLLSVSAAGITCWSKLILLRHGLS